MYLEIRLGTTCGSHPVGCQDIHPDILFFLWMYTKKMQKLKKKKITGHTLIYMFRRSE